MHALPPHAFDALSALERVVVQRYYGLDGDRPATQREIARECSISSQRVGSLAVQAVARLLAPALSDRPAIGGEGVASGADA